MLQKGIFILEPNNGNTNGSIQIKLDESYLDYTLDMESLNATFIISDDNKINQREIRVKYQFDLYGWAKLTSYFKGTKPYYFTDILNVGNGEGGYNTIAYQYDGSSKLIEHVSSCPSNTTFNYLTYNFDNTKWVPESIEFNINDIKYTGVTFWNLNEYFDNTKKD